MSDFNDRLKKAPDLPDDFARDKFGWSEGDITITGIKKKSDHAAKKMSKAEVNYVDQGDMPEICEMCSMFVSPDGCTAVAGKISPDGSCDIWEADDTKKHFDPNQPRHPSGGPMGGPRAKS